MCVYIYIYIVIYIYIYIYICMCVYVYIYIYIYIRIYYNRCSKDFFKRTARHMALFCGYPKITCPNSSGGRFNLSLQRGLQGKGLTLGVAPEGFRV